MVAVAVSACNRPAAPGGAVQANLIHVRSNSTEEVLVDTSSIERRGGDHRYAVVVFRTHASSGDAAPPNRKLYSMTFFRSDISCRDRSVTPTGTTLYVDGRKVDSAETPHAPPLRSASHDRLWRAATSYVCAR